MEFASAPGKVLLTGGYLVLDQPNAGLVLSTSARFFASAAALREAGPDNEVKCFHTFLTASRSRGGLLCASGQILNLFLCCHNWL